MRFEDDLKPPPVPPLTPGGNEEALPWLPPHLRSPAPSPQLQALTSAEAAATPAQPLPSTPPHGGEEEPPWQRLQQLWQQGFLPHWQELRQRLAWVAGWGILALIPAGYSAAPAVRWLEQLAPPHVTFIQVHPAQGVAVLLNTTFVLAGALTLPWALWHLAGFIFPALNATEKAWVQGLSLLAGLCFGAGVVLAALWGLPPALALFYQWGLAIATPTVGIEAYVTFCTQFCTSVGLLCLWPVAVLGLGGLRLLHRHQLQRYWRELLVGGILLAALVTPSQDALTLLLVSGLLLGLYALSLAGLWALEASRPTETPTT